MTQKRVSGVPGEFVVVEAEVGVRIGMVVVRTRWLEGKKTKLLFINQHIDAFS